MDAAEVMILVDNTVMRVRIRAISLRNFFHQNTSLLKKIGLIMLTKNSPWVSHSLYVPGILKYICVITHIKNES